MRIKGIDTVSIIVSTEALAPAREEILRRIQDELQPDHVSVEDGLALIAVVGQGMIYAKGTAARIFRVIADANINIRMIDQGSCELNIIIAVKADIPTKYFAYNCKYQRFSFS